MFIERNCQLTDENLNTIISPVAPRTDVTIAHHHQGFALVLGHASLTANWQSCWQEVPLPVCVCVCVLCISVNLQSARI